MNNNSKFVFKKHDTIGLADASDDKKYLDKCFLQTEDYSILKDCSDARRIVIGRTGIGKTAILQQIINYEERTISVQPESLALSHISNSTILNYLNKLGVKLDIFFRLLWRHVFTVEILKYRFKIRTEEDKQSFLKKIAYLFKDKKHKEALEYLEKWGKSFWEETEYRIKELTQKLESDLETAVKSYLPGASFDLKGGAKLTNEQKDEIIHRAQDVVNRVQIRQLSDILDLLNEVLCDRQKSYFVCIDRLDEKWVSDNVRYLLIRSLIETVRDFRKVENVKIIVAIRVDLLERVFKKTRDPGFQEEKYESLYLPLEWTEDQLIKIVEKRLNFLIESRYTKQDVKFSDIFPREINSHKADSYILDRTMLRPREIIQFINLCIKRAKGNPNITEEMIVDAEGEYSRLRLRSIADEWNADYPNLILAATILKNRKKEISISDFERIECEEFCLDVTADGFEKEDILSNSIRNVAEGIIGYNNFIRTSVEVFFRVGVIGVKLNNYDNYLWSTTGRKIVSGAEFSDVTNIFIHPQFWRVFGISN